MRVTCIRPVIWLVASGVLFAQTSEPPPVPHDHDTRGAKVILLPRDLEIRLAVNALPKDLREGAAVLVLQSGGYIKIQQGTNLMVRWRWPSSTAWSRARSS